MSKNPKIRRRKALTLQDVARADARYSVEAFDFLLDRSIAYLRIGDLAAASADIEQAIAQNPQEGRAYYVRANIVAGQGDHAAALADLERATELARAAGDAQLEATARTQWAMMMQSQPYPQPTLTP